MTVNKLFLWAGSSVNIIEQPVGISSQSTWALDQGDGMEALQLQRPSWVLIKKDKKRIWNMLF